MKKKIVYINPMCFIDTDNTVLSHLSKKFNITWFPILSFNDNCKMTDEQIKSYSEDNNIVCRPIKIPFRLRSLKNIPIYFDLIRKTKKEGADLYFTCTNQIYFILLLKLLVPSSKIIFGFHDVRPHSSNKSWLPIIINKIVTRIFKNFVTFSYGQQKYLLEDYNKKSRVLGMSYKYLGSSLLKPPALNDKIHVLFFGSLHSYKGVDILIRAAENLYDKGIRNLKITIAGEGPAWVDCEPCIKHREIFDIHKRFIKNEEIPDFMASHHFFVLPYRDVTNSGPLMMAIAYNLPVIAPNLGSFKEILDSNSPLLYNQGHLEETLEYISSIKELDYQKLVSTAAEIKECYSEERIANNYIKYFNEILNS